MRMIETFIFLAASTAAPQVFPLPSGHDQSPSVTAIETHPAPCDVLESTFNAFVAVEESPDLREIVRPAIVVRAGEQQALVDLSATAWIS